MAEARGTPDDIDEIIASLNSCFGWNCPDLATFKEECNRRFDLKLQINSDIDLGTWEGAFRALRGEILKKFVEDHPDGSATPKPRWSYNGIGMKLPNMDWSKNWKGIPWKGNPFEGSDTATLDNPALKLPIKIFTGIAAETDLAKKSKFSVALKKAADWAGSREGEFAIDKVCNLAVNINFSEPTSLRSIKGELYCIRDGVEALVDEVRTQCDIEGNGSFRALLELPEKIKEIQSDSPYEFIIKNITHPDGTSTLQSAILEIKGKLMEFEFSF